VLRRVKYDCAFFLSCPGRYCYQKSRHSHQTKYGFGLGRASGVDIIINLTDFAKVVRITQLTDYQLERRGDWLFITLQTQLGTFRFELVEKMSEQEQQAVVQMLDRMRQG